MIRSIPVALAFALISTQAAAWDRMLRSECQTTVEKLFDLMPDPVIDNRADVVRGIRVTPQGWCQFDANILADENLGFDRFEWRAEKISLWTRDGVPPIALELRVTGIDPDTMQPGAPASLPDLTIEATLRQVPDAGQVIVERAQMSNGAGDVLAVSAVFERVFLSSPAMMQVSLGSVAFKAGLFEMTLDGTHENPFAFGGFEAELRGTPEDLQAAAFDIISGLPSGVVDDASRAELMAYAGDLPQPAGTLEIQASSDRGLGLMQVGMAAYMSADGLGQDDDLGAELDILLDGITASVNWSPAQAQAD